MIVKPRERGGLTRFALTGTGALGSAAQFDFHLADDHLVKKGPPVLTLVLAKTRKVGVDSFGVSVIRDDVEVLHLSAMVGPGGRLRRTKFRDSGSGLFAASRDRAFALAVLESFFAKPAEYDLSDAQDALAIHLARSLGHDVTDIAGLWLLGDRGFMMEAERFINDLPSLMDRELLHSESSAAA